MNPFKQKLFLWGRDTAPLQDSLRKRNAILVQNADDADLILSYGGDGTLFSSEQRWPGKLKYAIRDAATAPLCAAHHLELQLDLFFKDQLTPCCLPKLCGKTNGSVIFGINDIFLHNRQPSFALRYSISIDEEQYAREVVGDSVGVATIHGSTAYYRNITHSTFRTGIGLAFCNSTEFVNHLVLPENARIQIDILRGPAVMTADNSKQIDQITEGNHAEIFISDLTANLLGLDIFMCSECRRLRHTLRDSSAVSKTGGKN